MFHIIIFEGDLSREVCGRGWQKLPPGGEGLGTSEKTTNFPLHFRENRVVMESRRLACHIHRGRLVCMVFFQRSHLVKKQFFHYKLDGKPGRLTQRKSAILTRWKSLVQIQYRLP